MYQNDKLKVLTGECRLSYAHLVTPREPLQPGAEAKYSVTLLIPKTDTITKADIDQSLQEAAQDAVSKVWGGVRPPVIKTPLYDGDGVRPSGEPFGEECKGHWVITASSKNKPQVVGQDNINVQLAPNDIYSGMYARVTIRFFGYSRNGNKGVGCGLGNVMKTRDGEALAGSAPASSDFATVGNAVTQPQPTSSMLWGTPPPTTTAPFSPQPTVTINPLTGQPI
ncbi:DUF2815 family protein [Eubacteriales bacterium OttesenSCG-928-G02]|nr:DUF2815 family protein [Eubacteriales bacterium OttesenSCG-928-G02]